MMEINNYFEPTVHISISSDNKLDMSAYAAVPNGSFSAGKISTGKPNGVQFDIEGIFHIQLIIENSVKIDSPVKVFAKPVEWSGLGLEIPSNTKQILVSVVLDDVTILSTQVIEIEAESIFLEDAQKFSVLENASEILSRKGLGDIRLLKRLKERPH